MAWWSSRNATSGSDRVQAPDWPNSRGARAVRVLVEHPEPVGRSAVARGLRERGYEVVACSGPSASGPDPMPACPLLEGAMCPAVQGADVVVSSLHLGTPDEGLIIQRIIESPSSPPLLLEASAWQVKEAFGTSSAILHTYPFLSVDQIVSGIEELGFPACRRSDGARIDTA